MNEWSLYWDMSRRLPLLNSCALVTGVQTLIHGVVQRVQHLHKVSQFDSLPTPISVGISEIKKKKNRWRSVGCLFVYQGSMGAQPSRGKERAASTCILGQTRTPAGKADPGSFSLSHFDCFHESMLLRRSGGICCLDVAAPNTLHLNLCCALGFFSVCIMRFRRKHSKNATFRLLLWNITNDLPWTPVSNTSTNRQQEDTINEGKEDAQPKN